MPRGGARPNAGRKAGEPNKATKEAIEIAAASGELPHEFLLRVSRGGKIDGHDVTFTERTDAAKNAAPYYAHRLASIEHTGPDGGPIDLRIANAKAGLAGKLAGARQGEAG